MFRENIIYTSFSKWRFDISKAEGSYIWTSDGRQLIDFTSGWNVANLGWNHPEIKQAVADELNKNTYGSMWMGGETQTKYARMLTEALPAELVAVGRATGGSEAIEEAIKTARAYTGRQKIVGFHNTYHGQTYGAMSIPNSSSELKDIAPVVPEFIQLEFPSGRSLDGFTEGLEQLLSAGDVAALVTEAGIVTGGGSLSIAPEGYLKILREITDKYNTLLILDEVGTGFSRCGKLFALEIEEVVPDILCLAKAQSNGMAPIGTMVTTADIAEQTYAKSSIGSTFGWHALAAAAALKTLEIHQRDKVWEKAGETGAYITKTLKSELASSQLLRDIRGIGMEIGIELVNSNAAAKVREKSLENGLHLPPGGDSPVLQLMPALNIERKLLDEGIDKLAKVIKSA